MEVFFKVDYIVGPGISNGIPANLHQFPCEQIFNVGSGTGNYILKCSYWLADGAGGANEIPWSVPCVLEDGRVYRVALRLYYKAQEYSILGGVTTG